MCVPVVLANNWTVVPIGVPTALATVSSQTIFSATGPAAGNGVLGNLPAALYVTTVAQQGTNAMPVVVVFDTTGDGVTWTTTAPIRITNTCFGNTNVTTWTTLTADQLRGVQQIRMGYVQAQTATPITVVSNGLAIFY